MRQAPGLRAAAQLGRGQESDWSHSANAGVQVSPRAATVPQALCQPLLYGDEETASSKRSCLGLGGAGVKAFVGGPTQV